MESKILNKLGIDPGILIIGLLVLCVLLIIVVIMLMVKVGNMSKRYNRFMLGKDAKSLEDSLGSIFSKLDKLILADMEREKQVRLISKSLGNTYQKVGIVKYDAFKEMGGKLSFVLAMLDAGNNGFVLNVMHSREACYTYIKEIIKGESYIALGDEEREALEKAMYIDD